MRFQSCMILPAARGRLDYYARFWIGTPFLGALGAANRAALFVAYPLFHSELSR